MPVPTKFTLDPALFNQDLYASILRFWLPTYPKPGSRFTQADMNRWFAFSAATDEQVRSIAGNALFSIGPDHLILPAFTTMEADQALYDEIATPFVPHLSPSSSTDKIATATGATVPADAHAALALSILLDQLPRNLFRGPAQSIVYTHYDRLSRAVANKIYSRGLDRAAWFRDAPVWRLWFYMSLEHSESVAAHERFHTILTEMLERAKDIGDDSGAEFVDKSMAFEERHLKPLKEFRRFPWRNQWLGRESTEAERAWLEGGGDTFGTG